MNEMRLIDANALPRNVWLDGSTLVMAVRELDEAPAVDAVSRGLFEQYKWERDIAIAQLEELGLSLGQKIDGVYISKEEYEKLIEGT